MGGGMAFREPYEYGFRYPYGDLGVPGYSSVFAPRRPSRFWMDGSYPDEGMNSARKRKLERVKGEPLVASNGENVREILVEGPSNVTNSTSLRSEAEREVTGISRPSASTSPSSPSSPLASANSNRIERHTVTIPVTFSSEAATHSVPVVLPEGTKKPKRTFNEETAATLIQSAYKGYSLRRTKPLEHMRRIFGIRTKLREIERRLSEESTVQKMRTDLNVRLRVTEGIMVLLLDLDSIQGVHSDVRIWRKAVTREVVMLQERVDALLSEERKLELEAVPVESSDPHQDEGHSVMASEAVPVESPVPSQGEDDFVMASDGGSVGKDEGCDEDMSDVVPKQSPPEIDNSERSLADEIVLHRLKLEDDKGRPHIDEMISNDSNPDYVTEHMGEDDVSLNSERNQAANVRELVREVEAPQPAISDTSQQPGEATSIDELGVNELAGSKIQTIADEAQLSAKPLEASEDNVLPEAIESVVMEGAAVEGIEIVTGSEALITENTTEIVEDGQRMEMDGELPREQDKEDECVRGSGDFGCCLRSDPLEQKKMKDFLMEISRPSEDLTDLNPSSLRSVEAEEAESVGAYGMFSEREEENGAVASCEQRSINGADDTEAICGLTEIAERDQLLEKLSEENKMLKSLLLDVMKWNQLQANSMKNLTERLGKLEERRTKKSRDGKPKAQRCPRNKLERRLRR